MLGVLDCVTTVLMLLVCLARLGFLADLATEVGYQLTINIDAWCEIKYAWLCFLRSEFIFLICMREFNLCAPVLELIVCFIL